MKTGRDEAASFGAPATSFYSNLNRRFCSMLLASSYFFAFAFLDSSYGDNCGLICTLEKAD